jgi:hypothetical protein
MSDTRSTDLAGAERLAVFSMGDVPSHADLYGDEPPDQDDYLDAAIRTVSAVHARRSPVTGTSGDWCDECCVDWPCAYEQVVRAVLADRAKTAALRTLCEACELWAGEVLDQSYEPRRVLLARRAALSVLAVGGEEDE